MRHAVGRLGQTGEPAARRPRARLRGLPARAGAGCVPPALLATDGTRLGEVAHDLGDEERVALGLVPDGVCQHGVVARRRSDERCDAVAVETGQPDALVAGGSVEVAEGVGQGSPGRHVGVAIRADDQQGGRFRGRGRGGAGAGSSGGRPSGDRRARATRVRRPMPTPAARPRRGRGGSAPSPDRRRCRRSAPARPAAPPRHRLWCRRAPGRAVLRRTAGTASAPLRRCGRTARWRPRRGPGGRARRTGASSDAGFSRQHDEAGRPLTCVLPSGRQPRQFGNSVGQRRVGSQHEGPAASAQPGRAPPT